MPNATDDYAHEHSDMLASDNARRDFLRTASREELVRRAESEVLEDGDFQDAREKLIAAYGRVLSEYHIDKLHDEISTAGMLVDS